MSAEAAFDALRALKRELTGETAIGLTQVEVDAFESIIHGWRPKPSNNPTALSDAGKFYFEVRTAFGSLSQAQVDGFQILLQAFGVARWPLSWTAYGLATAWHETNATMQPVEEAYYLGGRADAYRKRLKYYPWHGRGYVQLTWKANYEKADEEIGLAGALIANPAMAMEPGVASEVMVRGMEQGWFCSRKLADNLPLSGRAGFDAYRNARRIINGTDEADKIAKEARQFEAALVAGGWR